MCGNIWMGGTACAVREGRRGAVGWSKEAAEIHLPLLVSGEGK